MLRPKHKTNYHNNHRKRLRKTAVETGFFSFEDHNLLELLLFNSMPRINTNEIAHKLLKHCGGIKGFLSADINTLRSCTGIGENTVLFLSVIGAVCKKYSQICENEEIGFVSVNDTRNYLYNSLIGQRDPVMSVLTLDGLHKINTQNTYKKNGVRYSSLTADVMKDILSDTTVFAFIAFFHPNGILAPDKDEIDCVYELNKFFCSAGIKLAEVLIATQNGCRFLSDTNIFDKKFFSGQKRPNGQPISEPIS